MKIRRLSFRWIGYLCLLSLIFLAKPGASASMPNDTPEDGPDFPVTLDLTDTRLPDALDSIFRNVKVPYRIEAGARNFAQRYMGD